MDIVMVPFHDYKKWIKEGFRTRDSHLYQHFEQREDINKILVVNRPISVAELLLKKCNWNVSTGKIIYKENGICLTQISEKTWCLDFLLPDFFRVVKEKKGWWFTAFQYKKVLNGINEAIRVLQLNKSILLLQNPMAIGAAEYVNCEKFVFDVIDNWIYHPQMKDKEIIKNNYDYVDTHADLISTVSEGLMETFKNNKNVKWIPNGVDIEYFSEAQKKNNFQHKIKIGYVGKIQDRVDFDIIEECLKCYENYEFVFLGPVYAQKDRIKKIRSTYRNIDFKGDIHYLNLPKEMKEFDIAIIPHKVDKFTNSMNPLKVYEYLAAGKVVVSTQVAGIEGVSKYVLVADDKENFIKQLDVAIALIRNGNVTTEEIVSSIPKECSWKYRTQMLIDEMDSLWKGEN